MPTIYKLLNYVFYPLALAVIYIRKIFKKEHHLRYKEKIFSKDFKISKSKNKLVWFHAASVGELMSVVPLIKKINEKNELDFLITTITTTSALIVEREFNSYENINHRFLPIDNPILIKKFLDGWKPSLALFVDSEIWPNFIFKIKDNKIPLILINARLSKKTFERWMLISGFAKKIFNSFDLCLASSENTKKYLEKLNDKEIKFIGNLKYSIEIEGNIFFNKNLSKLKNYNYWCAASTHFPEERFCIETHKHLSRSINNLLTVIIPRHIIRSEEIGKVCKNNELNFQILNENDEINERIEILIVNSYGKLPQFFKYCRSVLMGKSLKEKFKSSGGQNPLEAVKLGCRVYHGPYISNFEDIFSKLRHHKISEKIESPEELSSKLINDFKNINNYKKSNNSELISDFGNRILEDTITKINEFIKK